MLFGSYQESRIVHMHNLIDRYIAKGTVKNT